MRRGAPVQRSGPALTADGLHVDRGMFLRDGFTATGAGERRRDPPDGARIGSDLDCTGAKLRNDPAPP